MLAKHWSKKAYIVLEVKRSFPCDVIKDIACGVNGSLLFSFISKISI